MSNPAEDDFLDVPEVPAEPDGERDVEELIGEEVDDPTVAEEDKE